MHVSKWAPIRTRLLTEQEGLVRSGGRQARQRLTARHCSQSPATAPPQLRCTPLCKLLLQNQFCSQKTLQKGSWKAPEAGAQSGGVEGALTRLTSNNSAPKENKTKRAPELIEALRSLSLSGPLLSLANSASLNNESI